uniref:Integrator complex subunit 12 n=1 Tax=Phallusia mammillata TaxID=59560 RepID=A0A6F9DEH8_9ASCI|nr:integrator complex subunit 12 [Phallusia mammillata]
MCSVVELDSIFIQALGYFQSRNPGTSATLKSLVDDSVEKSQRPKDTKELLNRLPGGLNKSSKPISKPAKPGIVASDPRRKEKEQAQKRHFEKVQRDLEEIDQEIGLSKKVHKSSMSPNGVNSPATTGRHNAKNSSPSHDGIVQNHSSYGKASPLANDEFELEMDALACVVCNQLSIGSGNQLVECQECHNLYHQDCHQPTVSDQEMNDPRYIWYCATCKRKLKKQAKQQMSKPPSLLIGNSLDVLRDKTTPVEVKTPTSLTPFKRNEMKPTLSSSTSGGSLQGWASLGKPPTNSQKPEDLTKHNDGKPESSPSLKPSTAKDKTTKAIKNHAKQAPSKYTVSDVWAEALGAKTAKPESKSSPKSNISNNQPKHNLLPSASRTPNIFDSISSQKSPSHKVGHSNSHLANKAAPYPKSSASMPTVPNKNNVQNQENAVKRLQLVKKKAAKMQQKRSRI